MTREEKRKIRIQIQNLLDQCKGCPHQFEPNAYFIACRKCEIGKEMRHLADSIGCRRTKNVGRKVGGPRVIWTPEEEQCLWENRHLPKKELAAKLNRPISSVYKKLYELESKYAVCQ
ncbi:hypothetical protein H839_08119 [Parageobacillus genomosp. 1]|uniref:Zinc-finger domain-containing protein n=1 Tax=Parageobacillus genomosp. 1 TaxID=1295642 RepID=A0ABC9VGQ3_9BACL|nr:hypothetical protein [Parageobacillus genomosp. 1]EZP77583.1 hypothetical protein H839_08119 [Parageobacillus genomosp. 1]